MLQDLINDVEASVVACKNFTNLYVDVATQVMANPQVTPILVVNDQQYQLSGPYTTELLAHEVNRLADVASQQLEKFRQVVASNLLDEAGEVAGDAAPDGNPSGPDA